MIEPFEKGLVRGYLHRPEQAAGQAIALTHGAGSNCRAALLTGISEAFEQAGFLVLRFDLPFRQDRPGGPPHPGNAARDRDGIRAAARALAELAGGAVFLGGHSYGGRQASMLAAEDSDVARGLLLLSYPLHPPKRPDQPRTAHFAKLAIPALFVHGSRDPFGTLEEMRAAIALIPARTKLVEIEGAGHDLKRAGAAQTALQHFRELMFPRYNSESPT